MRDDDTPVPVLLSGARTPFGCFRGSLAPLHASQLGAHAIRAALVRAEVAAADVDAVVLGQVVQAGTGQGPARHASTAAGTSHDVPAMTVNKICLPGLSAIIDAARLVRLGEADVVVAGGQESMTRSPHLLHGARTGLGYGAPPSWTPPPTP